MTAVIWVEESVVLALHEEQLAEHGGAVGLRDLGLLQSAMAQPQHLPGTDWNRLRRISEAEIRTGIEADPDAHPTDEAFWKTAKVVFLNRKKVVTMRLDADPLDWFRQQRGYQTRLNSILRTYMKANEGEAPHHKPA